MAERFEKTLLWSVQFSVLTLSCESLFSKTGLVITRTRSIFTDVSVTSGALGIKVDSQSKCLEFSIRRRTKGLLRAA